LKRAIRAKLGHGDVASFFCFACVGSTCARIPASMKFAELDRSDQAKAITIRHYLESLPDVAAVEVGRFGNYNEDYLSPLACLWLPRCSWYPRRFIGSARVRNPSFNPPQRRDICSKRPRPGLSESIGKVARSIRRKNAYGIREAQCCRSCRSPTVRFSVDGILQKPGSTARFVR